MKKLICALPYLHRELYSLPDGICTLWPGLPHQPSDTWQPNFPGSSDYAASLLSYFERLTLDGASGTSVAALQTMPLSELSPSEQAALRAFSGIKEETVPPVKTTAWQILLLSYLKEKQALELSDLERKISDSRHSLNNILQEHDEKIEEDFSIRENELPPWRDILFALLSFLPDIPEGTEFFIQSRAMSESVKQLLNGSPENHITAKDCLPLCSKAHQDQLRRNFSSDEWEKIFSVTLAYGEK